MSLAYSKEWVYQMQLECAKCIDEKIKLAIKPKPKWCPNKLYWWLLRKILYLEVFKERHK
jgi:hypothetical protein